MGKKILTVGIPAYKAEKHICEAVSSVMIQSVADQVKVIISSDDPNEPGKYDFVKERFPDMEIKVLDCDKNEGPGIARQRALDACDTEWITFIDADDVFIHPLSLESLLGNVTSNCIEVQGPFFQEIDVAKNMPMSQKQEIIKNGGQVPPRMAMRNDPGHPWVFGRMYKTGFLKENKIRFSKLRAMEDGEFNWKIRLLIEGTGMMINVTQDPIYFWRTGSEHSITRIGIKKNGGVPLYNWDLCLVGSTAAAINAIIFSKEKNPFNGSILRFTVEQMIGHYFSYVRCLALKKMFAKQVLFNAKRFYHSVYKDVEGQINNDILKTMYTAQYAALGQDMVGVIPKITFWNFMDKIKNEPYGGKDEFDKIRQQLPKWVRTYDMKSGVLGEEGYIYTTGEKRIKKDEESRTNREDEGDRTEEN